MTSPETVPLQPGLDHVATLVIHVAEPIEVGRTAHGQRRMIPITGGTITGPRLSGRVIPGGADYQIIESPTFTRLEAKYVLETDDGDRAFIDNRGIRTGSADDVRRLAEGLPVDPAKIYFRSVAQFETAADSLAWLQEKIFIGVGSRYPDRVELDLFQLN